MVNARAISREQPNNATDRSLLTLTIAPMLSSPNAILALKFLFLTLAFVTGARLTALAVARESLATGGLESSAAGRVLAAAVLGAVTGAKLVFAAGFPALWAGEEMHGIWVLAAGFSVPGALAGLWLGLWLAAPARTGVWADTLTPAVIAMLLIVDAGATLWSLSEPGFGAPARHWGVDFGDGVRRHPVMLYDAAFLLAMWWANRTLQHQGWSMPGLRASVLWGSYFAASLLLAFLRPPFGPALLLEKIQITPYMYAPGLTAEQWLCIAVSAVLAVASVRVLWRRPDQA